jgi:hypothetical protein
MDIIKMSKQMNVNNVINCAKLASDLNHTPATNALIKKMFFFYLNSAFPKKKYFQKKNKNPYKII